MNEEKKAGFQNKSLERALQIMNAFQADRRELTVWQLSKILGLPRATILRLCTTLLQYDYLRKDPISKQYSLGIRFFDLGSIVYDSFSLRSTASPHLSQLQMKVGNTLYLGILDNDWLLYIDKRDDPNNPVNFTSRIGTRRPPHWGMLGLVIMAHLPDSEVDRLLQKHPLTRLTKKTITTKEEYKKRLHSVEKQEYVFETGEVFNGISGVAAPIRDFSGNVIAAVGVGFISSSVDGKGLRKIIKEVVETARTVSQDMGCAKTE
jgi:IclR family transcriptional regulator, KDG regulon repressor